MSQTIWKFPLKYEVTHLMLPVGAKILHVHGQDDRPCLWVQVSPGGIPIKRSFVLVGTGQPIPEDQSLEYVGTAHLYEGTVVMHVFEGGGS